MKEIFHGEVCALSSLSRTHGAVLLLVWVEAHDLVVTVQDLLELKREYGYQDRLVKYHLANSKALALGPR